VSGVFRNNGISYLSVPSRDYRRSAEFYHAVFRWKVRVESNHASFEDGTGHVIGHLEPQFEAAGGGGSFRSSMSKG
jgi:predicted enzyme related to lactoylglutathione lyase